MKADDEVVFEDDDGKMKPEKYSNFERLIAKVEVLQEQVEVMGRILKQHNMTEIKEDYNMTPDFEDETYKKLEENEG